MSIKMIMSFEKDTDLILSKWYFYETLCNFSYADLMNYH